MRIVNKNVNGRKLYYEQFNSYDEYINVVEDRQSNSPRQDKVGQRLIDHLGREWCGVKTYDEAKKLLVNGWDTQVEDLKKKIKDEVSICDEKKVIKYFSSMAGFMPIVPNAILGLPNSMLSMRSEMKKQKVVKFLILMNRTWKYSSKEIIEKMSKAFARIVVLEKNGYRCRVELFGSFSYDNDDKTIVAHSVLIKSENQLLDVKRVCFPLVHSAMQRVFGFSWENSVPINYDEYHCSNLGRSIQYWNKKERDALLNAINEKNENMVVIGMETNLDELFDKKGGVKDAR